MGALTSYAFSVAGAVDMVESEEGEAFEPYRSQPIADNLEVTERVLLTFPKPNQNRIPRWISFQRVMASRISSAGHSSV